jgi:hypothetical protein
MEDMKKHIVISAATVSRLVQKANDDREKGEKTSAGKVMRYYIAKGRCERCARNDYKDRCKFMRENRYYPSRCIAYKEKEIKP